MSIRTSVSGRRWNHGCTQRRIYNQRLRVPVCLLLIGPRSCTRCSVKLDYLACTELQERRGVSFFIYPDLFYWLDARDSTVDAPLLPSGWAASIQSLRDSDGFFVMYVVVFLLRLSVVRFVQWSAIKVDVNGGGSPYCVLLIAIYPSSTHTHVQAVCWWEKCESGEYIISVSHNNLRPFLRLWSNLTDSLFFISPTCPWKLRKTWGCCEWRHKSCLFFVIWTCCALESHVFISVSVYFIYLFHDPRRGCGSMRAAGTVVASWEEWWTYDGISGQ